MTTDPNFSVSSFFAGIGGFDLGLETAGFTTKFQCENNRFCNSVLQRHWNHVPKANDVSDLTPDEIPDTELWAGGFPCQDVSVARGWLGRDGLKGKNTGLFYPFYELVAEKRPTVLLLENVLGLLSSHHGNDFFVILKLLTRIGYGVSWRVLNTRYFGAPQSRPRVYAVAWQARPDLAVSSLYENAPSSVPENPRLGFLREQYHPRTGAYVPEVSYCLAATSGRHTGTDWSRSYVSYDDAVRRLTPRECEGLQGFPFGWTYPDHDFHLTQDEVDTLRYHALGNAVSVPTVTWVGQRIMANIRTQLNTSPAPLNADLSTLCPDLGSPKKRVQRLDFDPDEVNPARWKSGGAAFGDHVVDVPVSPSPCQPIPSSFVDVLEEGTIDDKYFLSPNAAVGILRRVDSQGRTLFAPLRRGLEALAALESTAHQNSLPNQLQLRPAS